MRLIIVLISGKSSWKVVKKSESLWQLVCTTIGNKQLVSGESAETFNYTVETWNLNISKKVTLKGNGTLVRSSDRNAFPDNDEQDGKFYKYKNVS